MASVTAGKSFSEDQFGKKVDRCITDTLVKAGTLHIKIDNDDISIHYVRLYRSEEIIIHRITYFTFILYFQLIGGGFLIGSVISLLFFKRRAFPLWIGTGFGFGVGFRNCESALNSNEKF